MHANDPIMDTNLSNWSAPKYATRQTNDTIIALTKFFSHFTFQSTLPEFKRISTFVVLSAFFTYILVNLGKTLFSMILIAGNNCRGVESMIASE